MNQIKLPFFSKKAKNTVDSRFSQLDSDGYPVYGYSTKTGIHITSDTALYSSAVFGCVRLLSTIVASLPLILYDRKDLKTVIPAIDNPLYRLLLFMPNSWQTAYDYWLWNMNCILLRGCFMSYINRSMFGNKEIYSLIPLHPDTINRRQASDGKIYISGLAAYGLNNYMSFEDMPQEKFFWANYMTSDSVLPCSPIKYSAETIGLDLTALNHGARVFKNDATPPLVVTTPQVLSKEGLKNYAAAWRKGGSQDNYGMPRFLDKGADIKRLSMSNEDAQYLQTRRFQKEDICGIYGVSPHLVGDTAKAKGWSTLENQDREFLKYTINPYLTNIEQAINRSLIPKKDWGRIYADFDTKMFMRANIEQRIKFYDGMYKMNAIEPDEIRIAEGLNPVEGGINNNLNTNNIDNVIDNKIKEGIDKNDQ